MKKSELISRLESMLELSKAPEIKEQLTQLINDLGPSTPEEKGKLTYYVKVNEAIIDPAVKYPRQMLECHKILLESVEPGTLLERKEILALIGEKAERLNTRQTPERIYAFYQKRMEDEGWLERAKERVMPEA